MSAVRRLGWILLFAALSGPAEAGETIRLRAAVLPPSLTAVEAGGERAADDLCILQFAGRPGRAERDGVAAAGAELLGYLPDDAYLLRAGAVAAGRLTALPGARRLLAYRPEWRIVPELEGARGAQNLHLEFAPGVDPEAAAAAARALGARVAALLKSRPRPRLRLRAKAGLLPALAALPGLIAIEPLHPYTDRNDDIKWICQSAVPVETPIWDRGLHGEGQVLGHIDSGFHLDHLDAELCWWADREGDPVGPEHRKVVFLGTAAPLTDGRHGTHTAGILAGDGYQAEAGADTTLRALAYKARFAHSNYTHFMTHDLFADLVIHAGQGARIHSNSWGNDFSTAYTNLCLDIDRFSWESEDNLVLFAATNESTLRTPENAKSVLSVVATQAGPNFDLFFDGGMGPTADGRRKPELCAPGQNINSAATNIACGEMNLSGTSMACPAAASAAALLRQYFSDGFHPSGEANAADALTPSGSLIRATLVNGAADLGGLAGYPGDQEGWGRVLLDGALPFKGERGELWLADPRHAEGLETGEERVYEIEVLSTAEPLRVTLAFADHPGEIEAAQPVVNDLDLTVSGPGGTFLGNVFDTVAGVSETGGAADPLNSLERVIVAEPAPGVWTLRVSGAAVPMGPQGFALVATADLAADTPVFLASFTLTPYPGAVDCRWEISPGAGAPRFRLEADRRGRRRRVDHAPAGAGVYTARDADPDLAAGGEVAYTLYGAEAGEDWQILRSAALELPPALARTRLLGAYPSPFNPRGAVRLALAEAGPLRAGVHDLSGRRLALLADGPFPAGTHDLAWDGRDDAGRPLASGVYLVRMEAGAVADACKLVLLR